MDLAQLRTFGIVQSSSPMGANWPLARINFESKSTRVSERNVLPNNLRLKNFFSEEREEEEEGEGDEAKNAVI